MKAIRFNIGKKLAQLHKVIELIKAQSEDRNYQIWYLKDKYGTQIDLVRQDYETEIADILEIYKNIESEIYQSVEKEYERKHEILRDELEAYIANSSINLREFHTKETSDISSLLQEVNALTNGFKGTLERFDEQCLQKKEDVQKKLRELDVTYQQEVNAHDDEAEKRISHLKRASEERIDAMKRQHEEDKSILANDNWQSTFSADVCSIHDRLRNRTHELKTSLNSGRAAITDMISKGMSTLDENKESFKRTLEQSGDSEAEFRSIMENLNAEMKLMAESNLQSIASLNKKKEEAAIKHKLDLQHKMDAYKTLIQENQVRIREKNDEIGRTFTDYEANIEELAEKHRHEIADFRQKHEKVLKESSLAEDRLHRDLMYLEESQIKNLQSFKQQLSDEKSAQKMKLEAEERLEQQDIQTRKRLHEDEMDKIRQDIIRLLNGGNEQEALANIEIERLKQAKNQILEESRSRISEYEKLHDAEVKKLRERNESDLQSLRSELERSLDERKRSDESELKTLQSQLDQNYTQCAADFELKHSDALSLVKLKHQDRSEKDALEIELNEKYKRELDVLSKTKEPSNESTKILDEMDQEIQKLIEEMASLKASIEEQRSSITSKWKRSIDSEAMKPPNSADTEDNCDWGNLDLIRSQISRVKDEYSIIADLKLELAHLKEAHERKVEALEVDLLRATSTDEITTKTELIEEATKSKWALVNEQRRRNKEEEDSVTQEVVAEEKLHAAAMEELDKSVADLMPAFESRKQQLIESSETLLLANKKRIQEENAQYEVTRHDYMQKFKSQIIDLKTQLEQLETKRSSQAKRFDEALANLESTFDHQMKALVKQQTESLNKLKSDQKTAIALSDEAIANLTAKRDSIKVKYEDMPSRESDLEEMRNLDAEAKMRLDLVQKVIKDLQEYRWMMQAREKDYSSRFGKPTVGVYDARSRPRTPR